MKISSYLETNITQGHKHNLDLCSDTKRPNTPAFNHAFSGEVGKSTRILTKKTTQAPNDTFLQHTIGSISGNTFSCPTPL